MDLAYVRTLRCPHCRGPFDADGPDVTDAGDLTEAVLTCGCGQFPVVAGIAVLRRSTAAEIVEAIRRGDAEAALRHAIYDLVPGNVRGRRRRSIDLLVDTRLPGSREIESRERRKREATVRGALAGSFADAVRRLHPARYASYLEQRYANPSLLGAMVVLSILDGLLPTETGSSAALPGGRRVLDLACGVGHSSHLIERLHPGSTVCLDHDFLNLLMLRRYFVPDAPALCVDLESTLPFADDAFDAIVCLDAFHYVSGKQALAAEMERVSRPEGGWLLPHVHNAQVPNVSAGLPLTLEGYRHCLGSRAIRMVEEGHLLRLYHHGEDVDLSEPRPAAALDASGAVCIVASGSDRTWRRYGDVATRFLADGAPLAVNPIYRPRVGASDVTLVQQWPDDRLRHECAEIASYLPEPASVDRTLWELLLGGRPGIDRAAEVLALMRRFVVVPLPRGFSGPAVELAARGPG